MLRKLVGADIIFTLIHFNLIFYWNLEVLFIY